jgi:SAM-dependent methyltransferase
MSMYEDGRYLANNPSWHEEHAVWKAENIAAILARNRVVPRTIAEIGCGTGRVIAELAEKVPQAKRLYGYEISPQAFDRAKNHATARVEYAMRDVLTSPPTEPFDVVMAIDVFEHVDNYLGFIKGLAALGTYKVFHIPLELSVSSMIRPATLERARAEVGHIHYFTRETALAALKAAGLEIVDERFTSVSIDHATALRTRLLRGPRRLFAAMAPKLAAHVFGGFSLLVLAR